MRYIIIQYIIIIIHIQYHYYILYNGIPEYLVLFKIGSSTAYLFI